MLLSPTPGETAGADFDLRLKVTVTFPGELAVRTDLAQLRIGGTVRVEGTANNPVLFGTLEARDGKILFRKQEFDVVAARARFDDPRRIDPILDVEAQTRIRQYDVTLRLTGRSEDLNVRFSSSPPLPQDDLLALVVFGVTRGELSRSAGGIAAGEAAQLLVRELLGVNPGSGVAGFQVDVDRSDEGVEVMRVERAVTQRIRAVFSQEVGGEGTRQLRVEYRLLGPLLVAGEQDFRGNYGADVLLRMRFR
jgi:translocation and assembly module TamB